MATRQCLDEAFQRFQEEPLCQERYLVHNELGLSSDLHHVLAHPFYRDRLQYHRRITWSDIRNWEGRYHADDDYFIQIVKQWSKNSTIWCSPTLDVDLALGIPIERELQEAIQTIMLVPSLQRSPGLFLITFFRRDDLCHRLEEKTVYLAGSLRKSLTRIIPGRLPYILPLVFCVEGEVTFSVNKLKRAVRNAWNNNVHLHSPVNHQRRWSSCTPGLSHQFFALFQDAISLLQCLSDVPTVQFKESGRSITYFMDPSFTVAVHSITQRLVVNGRSRTRVSVDEYDYKVMCAIVEAARRLAFRGPTKLIYRDSFYITNAIVSSLESLNEQLAEVPDRLTVTARTGDSRWRPVAELRFAFEAEDYDKDRDSRLEFFHDDALLPPNHTT